MEETKTLEELQQEAVSLGVAEATAQSMPREALLATVNALQATKVQAAPPTQVAPMDPVASPVEEKATEQLWRSKAEQMRALLMKQPKVRILVPLEGQEKVGVVRWVFNEKTKRDEQVHVSGAIQPVTLNGFTYIVPKGTYDDAPQQVADTITDKLQQTTQAGANLLLDRTDPETGHPVRNQLS